MEGKAFVRLPSELLDALLQVRLSETGWRILLWVIRQSYGWNRQDTAFSWYRIARELSADRGGVVRTGNLLLRANLLCIRNGRLGIQEDAREWDRRIVGGPGADTPQLTLPGIIADRRPRKPMTCVIANDDGHHLKRCQASSLFRRAKDRCKDKIKTYKDRRRGADTRHHADRIEDTERRHLAGAARPLPGKYDGLSKN
jgi:phage replication O-like protein O